MSDKIIELVRGSLQENYTQILLKSFEDQNCNSKALSAAKDPENNCFKCR